MLMPKKTGWITLSHYRLLVCNQLSTRESNHHKFSYPLSFLFLETSSLSFPDASFLINLSHHWKLPNFSCCKYRPLTCVMPADESPSVCFLQCTQHDLSEKQQTQVTSLLKNPHSVAFLCPIEKVNWACTILYSTFLDNKSDRLIDRWSL